MRNLINGSILGDFEDLFKPVERFPKTMRTDIKETDKEYEFDIDMPGYKKDEINIDLNEGYLTISANKEVKEEANKNNNYIKRERHFSASRSYFVGDNIKEDDIKAKYENGVLNIVVPKEQPKELPKHKIKID